MAKLDYQPKESGSPGSALYLFPGVPAVLLLGSAALLPPGPGLGAAVLGAILLAVALYMKAKGRRPL